MNIHLGVTRPRLPFTFQESSLEPLSRRFVVNFNQTIEETIRLADARWASEGGEPVVQHRSLTTDLSDVGPGPSPEEVRLKQFLDGLPRQTVYKLLLTMYLGLADESVSGWREIYTNLTHNFETPSLAVAQLCEKPTLGEYLRTGRALFDVAGIDLDSARP